MSKKKIVVIDDEEAFVDDLQNRLQSVRAVNDIFEIIPINKEDFKKHYEILSKRYESLRKGNYLEDECVFDKADVLIVDYDLFELRDCGPIDGDRLVYESRCFTRCGVIISLNKRGSNIFDLTLVGDLSSYADLDLGSEQIDNEGLWGGNVDGFRPWQWPSLPLMLDTMEKKESFVLENYDNSIMECLGLGECLLALPTSVLSFFGEEPSETTFRTMLESGNALQVKDRGVIKYLPDEIKLKLAVSRVTKWVETQVVSGQDILVDAPHLVSRYPSLLLDLPDDPGELKLALDRTAGSQNVQEFGLKLDLLEGTEYDKSIWASRPVWFWNRIMNRAEIEEVREPWTKRELPLVFCEDASGFFKRTECSTFYADVPSPYTQRYVRCFEGVSYEPRMKLSLPGA